MSYNGGAFEQLAIFEEDPSLNGGSNSFLSQDTNADGKGDAGNGTGSTAIEQGFKNFSFPLNSTNTVQIRIVVDVSATGEVRRNRQFPHLWRGGNDRTAEHLWRAGGGA